VAISNPAGQQGEAYLVIVYEVGEELIPVDIAEGVVVPLVLQLEFVHLSPPTASI
jgi:hypothetical protein